MEKALSFGDTSAWFRNGGASTWKAYEQLTPREQQDLREYLKSLPLNLDLSLHGVSYKLVHAAPVDLFAWHRHRYGSRYIDETDFAVWHRFEDFWYLPEEYITVFGHTPTFYYQEKNPLSVWHGENAIGIDCGSGFPDAPTGNNPFQGRLCCLRLDDMKEFYSEDPGSDAPDLD